MSRSTPSTPETAASRTLDIPNHLPIRQSQSPSPPTHTLLGPPLASPQSQSRLPRSQSPGSPVPQPQPQSSNTSDDRSSSTTISTAITRTPSVPRLTRKLPPALTESLECLASNATDSGHSRSSSDNHSHSNPAELSPKNESYVLDVATPLPTSSDSSSQQASTGQLRKISIGSINKSSISSPLPLPIEHEQSLMGSPRMSSRPSTADSSIITPSSSLRAFARHSFARSSLPNSNADSSPVACSSGSTSASVCGTWPGLDDHPHGASASPSRSGRTRESRKEKKARKRAEQEAFDIDTPPSMRELFEASILEVVDEAGASVKFGDLVRNRKTIVVFIRHWFCPLCAQYMNSILAEVSLDALQEAEVDLIIIGNGSAKMLNGYRNKAFKCPFKMYTDPTLALYRKLGLTRQTGNAGPDTDKGAYLIQTPLESTIQTIKRATQMPLRNPGHFTQLGGEFIFDSTLQVSYTHRMSTTRDHAPIRDVCEEAGVRLEFIHYEPGEAPPPVHRYSWSAAMGGLQEEEEQGGEAGEDDTNAWLEERDRQVEAIKTLRRQRRAGYLSGMSVIEGKKVPQVQSCDVRIVGQDDVEEAEERFGTMGVAY